MKSGSSASAWGTTPTRARAWRACAGMSRPSSRMRPASGSTSPRIAFSVVLLPAPLGPSRPKHSPRRTAKSSPSIASTPAKRLTNPETLRISDIGSRRPRKKTRAPRGADTAGRPLPNPSQRRRPPGRRRAARDRASAGARRALGLCLFRAVHQLDQRHRRGVARAEPELQDPQVAAVALGIARAEFVEQLDDHLAVAQPVERQAPVGQRRLAAERDDRLDDAAQLLGLGQRGLDQLVPKQRVAHVAQHRLAMGAGAVQLA